MGSQLVAIVGPTATGKTEASLWLAQKLGGEVISADSMQVYRGMDIGTAKAGKKERERVRHHLLDVVEPDTEYTVVRYQREARQAIADIAGRNRLPLLVGGTGLYIQAVVDDYDFAEKRKPDWELRRQLREEAEEKGRAHLHARLKKIDPESAARIHPNDRKRVIRALEVYMKTGEKMSERKARRRRKDSPYSLAMLGLYYERQQLYARINERVERMMEHGLLEEVERLQKRGLSENAIAMQAVGYKELLGYLAGEYDLQEAVRLVKRNTRRLAKRQLTWFRRDERISWFNPARYLEKEDLYREMESCTISQLPCESS